MFSFENRNSGQKEEMFFFGFKGRLCKILLGAEHQIRLHANVAELFQTAVDKRCSYIYNLVPVLTFSLPVMVIIYNHTDIKNTGVMFND